MARHIPILPVWFRLLSWHCVNHATNLLMYNMSVARLVTYPLIISIGLIISWYKPVYFKHIFELWAISSTAEPSCNTRQYNKVLQPASIIDQTLTCPDTILLVTPRSWVRNIRIHDEYARYKGNESWFLWRFFICDTRLNCVPHISNSQASNGVSIMSSWLRTDRVISRPTQKLVVF